MKALTKIETNADGKRKPVAGTKQISHLQFSKEELQMNGYSLILLLLLKIENLQNELQKYKDQEKN